MNKIDDIIDREKRDCSPSEQNHFNIKRWDRGYDDNGGNERNQCHDTVDNELFGGQHFIVSGSEDGAVCIWDRITTKMMRLEGHQKAVNCIEWNPKDSFLLVSGSHDCTIRVWAPSSTDNRFHF